jgi:tetratricopeptide (TPR) repeat protein
LPVGAAFPDRPAATELMIFATDPAKQCFNAAQHGKDLRYGLEHCDLALRDPFQKSRAGNAVNRGIIRYDLGDYNGALNDFNIALAYDPGMGDAYLNRALVLVAERKPDEATAAINRGIALGGSNLQTAYYTRAAIEDDAGQFAQAYRDYKQALTVKPDYAPAAREIARFHVEPQSAVQTIR